jgi:hypothetical protein
VRNHSVFWQILEPSSSDRNLSSSENEARVGLDVLNDAVFVVVVFYCRFFEIIECPCVGD